VLAGGEFYLLNPKDTAMLKAYARLQARLNSVRNEEEGASAVEYALVIGLISIVVVGALTALFGGFGAWIAGLDAPWVGE